MRKLPLPPPKKIARVLAGLDEEKHDRLVGYLLDKNEHGEWERTSEWVATLLSLDGVPVSDSHLRNYRRRIDLRQDLI